MTMIGEIAAEALRRLDEDGWTQFSCESPDGAVCMGTALWDAAGLPHDRKPDLEEIRLWADISHAVSDAIREIHADLPFSPVTAVPKFNDHNSQDEVRAVLEKMKEA